RSTREAGTPPGRFDRSKAWHGSRSVGLVPIGLSRRITMLSKVLCVAIALTVGSGQIAGAQSGMRFQGMDRNNDGKITRAEWNGSDRSFQVHDWNGDGVLSG